MNNLRKILRKNIWQEFKFSFARFISISILLALGTFVLIGLKVTGNDMRATGNTYFHEHQMADAQVTSQVGFNRSDRHYLTNMSHVKQAEFSQYKDAVLSGSNKTVRLNEKTTDLSLYKPVKGRLPHNSHEIALSKYESSNYKLGQHISLVNNHGHQNVSGLKHTKYKVVGFVTSSDYLRKRNLGTSNAGKGQIDTFAVLTRKAFSQQLPNVAKISYNNLKGAGYSNKFENQLNRNVNHAQAGLTKQAERRQEKLQQQALDKVQDQTDKLQSQQASFDRKQDQLKQAKTQINEASSQLSKAQQALTAKQTQTAQLPMGPQKTAAQQQLQKQQQQLQAEQVKINTQQQQYQQNSHQLQTQGQKIKQAQEKIASKKSEIKNQSKLTYQLQTRKDYNQGYNQFGEAAKRIDVLSNTFPLIFFAVAILVTLTTMSRMAEEKRIDIGTLRALGYTKFDALKMFLVYGSSAAILGAAIGSFFGTWLLPQRIYAAYAANLAVPALKTPPSGLWIGVSLAFALICTVIPAIYVVWNSLQEEPAKLMTEKPPRSGAKVLLEKVPFIWQKLSFDHKVTIRNLFRYKSRMFMTIIGIFGCTSLLITGFGLRDSLNGIVDNQYQKIVHYDVIGVFDPQATQSQKTSYKNKVSNMDEVKKQGTIYYESVTAKPKDAANNQQVSLIVPQAPTKFGDFMTLRNPTSHKKIQLQDNGAVITEKLARLGGYQAGDHLALKDNAGKKHRVKVSGISQLYVGHDVVMNSAYYHKVFGQPVKYNAKILNLHDRSAASIDRVSGQLNSQQAAVTAVQSNQAKDTVNTILNGLNNIVLIIVLASSVLSFVVLFTLTNINVSERIRELATLRVLGFYRHETVMYVYRETMILTILGILAGFGGGYYLHHFIMETLPPENALADMNLLWTNFTLSTVITLFFSLIVMLIMARKINKIDMQGALKSVD